MSETSVLTVILNWRTPDMALQSLEAARIAMADVPGEIVMVDNDSQDGSYEQMVEATKGMERVRVVQSGRNGGFGAGNNVGIRGGLGNGTRPGFVYVLNSDAFPEPEAIKTLRQYLMDHPKVGFAGSHIVGDDGHDHMSTFRFPSARSELEGAARIGPISRLLRSHIIATPVPEVSGRVDWLAGASLMMRQSVLDEIGLFDETFFLYFEETDLCLRAARAGHETHFVRDSKVVHIGSVSTGMKEWAETPGYWFASRHYYFAKNHGKLGLILATKAHALGGALHRIRMGLSGKRPHDPPRFLRRLIGYDMRNVFRKLGDHSDRSPNGA